MKRSVISFIIAAAAALIINVCAYAGTVINAPVDSRPVSCEYLGDLVELGGDTYIQADKENLDYFTAQLADSKFGDSEKVRADIFEKVSANNKRSTTVIINSSSYITNGLVGSRCGKNYKDIKTAMQDLETLLDTNKEPTYYFNLCMPRALPETRFNTIWREKDSPELLGIAHFYLECVPDAPDAAYIKANYEKVDPSQFLLEYGYVANKAAERGQYGLTDWEKRFLKYFRTNFLNKQPYKEYIEDYKRPYAATAEIFSYLLDYQRRGLLDEIIVSNDDLKLPNSISYFYGKKADWVQTEKGTPIKYSFPRTMLATGHNSIYSLTDRAYGSRERSYAMVGRGKKINFIFGMDEVPQLIYARSLSERENCTADLKVITNNSNRMAGEFDVSGIQSLLDSTSSFVGAGHKKTDRKFELYLYNYNAANDHASFLQKMKKSYNKGNNIGLIEIFAGTGTSKRVFKEILSGNAAYPSVTELSSYSAWNTNGNAIGLGIAHSQVFAVSEQKHHNPTGIINAQLNILARHIYEDGVYTGYVKLALANEGYKPGTGETYNSAKLKAMLEETKVVFKGKTYRMSGKEYLIKKLDMKAYGFPWRRIFDIYMDFDVKTELVQGDKNV
ncbi:MAG: DUF4127 family protein [Firmicutes bacterium]|nr:DUF4127 family protein [Bacillota bacterium]